MVNGRGKYDSVCALAAGDDTAQAMRQPKIITTLQNYSRSLFLSDLVAGITVAMVALPLSIAIAIASGAEPAKGIVTAIVGGFFISLFGGSRVQIGGPTGAFIVVVFGVIADHGYDGLVLATLMAGMILMIAGYFRLGGLISLVPEAVISGFTIGIAVIIATSQINDFFGLALSNLPAEFLEKVVLLWQERNSLNGAALMVALVTLVLIIAFRRLFPKFPGLIVAVAIGSALAAYPGFTADTISSRFGELTNQFPGVAIPAISVDRLIELLPSALIIAFLAGVESLLSAIVADRMIEGHHRPNAELTAQGIANIASSLFAGLPVTGAIARTATNINAGGRTPVAGIIHAIVILIILILAAPLAGYLAMPALAALLVLTAWNMSEPHRWKSYLSLPRAELMLLLTTFVLTVTADLTVAIGVGVALGLALRLRESNLPPQPWDSPDR